ncbi:MAG: hypothetical protein WKF35_09490 [Ferruginibacter sp.]
MHKLKVGLLIDHTTVPLYVYKLIEQINNCDYAEFTLIIKNKDLEGKHSFFTRLKHSYKNLFYSIYLQVDKRVFNVKPNAFEPADITSLIEKIPLIQVIPHSTTFSHRFREEDLAEINSHGLDVILRMGFKILRGAILNAAKYGIWSYHHGDNNVNRGGPPGVWEFLHNCDETGVILQILTEDLDGGIVIDRSYSKTDNSSVIRNNNNSYWKALSMIPRNLKELYTSGGTVFMERINAKNNAPYFYFNKLFVNPTNLEFTKFFIIKILKKIKDKVFQLFFNNQWILLYSFNKSERLSQSFFRFKKIQPPKDRFWADPFAVHKNGLYYIFFEELMYKTHKGHLAVLTIDNKGNISTPVTILEKDYHLSYPFVMESDNKFFLIPECVVQKRIDLYQCIDFPHKWEFVRTLMNNVSAVDATIHFHDNKYWMFCNIKENEGASTSDELFIFYADHFNSTDWHPHAKNPVISDVKKARPAGKIFKYKNEYYRPSQDCSRHYGRGININRIILLNENEYVEETIQNMYSNWEKSISSIHTINFAGDLTIIDGQTRRSKY